ncbi:MAG: TolC family protein [Acidobacteria bacterium]|nr:TolC family protein [Acidobacteriota bacterium]
MNRRKLPFWGAILSAVLFSAVQAQTTNVSKQVEARTGHRLNPAAKPVGFALPEGVSLDDGVSEDEAVAIALWNNPALQAELAALGLARADVIEAGQLRNPNLTLILPFSVRVLEAVALWPFDVLWQRPHRVAAAKLELNRTEETLAAMALDLVRDVRLAYADALLAESRSRIAAQAARERNEIAVIVNAQFRVGEISELETNASRLDASLAAEQAGRFANDVSLARIRLHALLGFGTSAQSFQLAPTSTSATPVTPALTVALPANATADPINELIKQAFEARPELKAAELAIEAAGQRAKWERSKILVVSAIAKEYGKGVNGFEQGPGLMIDLPIFNRNGGAISRAETDIERAAKQLAAARHRVAMEVQQAYAQLEQERQSLERWRMTVQPQTREELRRAERAYAAGDVAYLLVLQTAQRHTDAQLREVELQAAQARAAANLERSIGRRLIGK